MLQRLFNYVIAVTFSTFGTRYGIRIRVAGMKILSPRPLDERAIFGSQMPTHHATTILHRRNDYVVGF
mgnify:CR=1 FL=1